MSSAEGRILLKHYHNTRINQTEILLCVSVNKNNKLSLNIVKCVLLSSIKVQ
jgi:hypothetical protein